MNRIIHSIIVASALCACNLAQGADVTVRNGDVTLTISTAAAGQAPDAATDDTGLLEWNTVDEVSVKKITVQTGLVSPRYLLKVQAIDITSGDGTAAGIIELSTTPTDFVVDIPTDIPIISPGTCTLHYTASAVAGDGTGSDNHTVTFTIMDQ